MEDDKAIDTGADMLDELGFYAAPSTGEWLTAADARRLHLEGLICGPWPGLGLGL